MHNIKSDSNGANDGLNAYWWHHHGEVLPGAAARTVRREAWLLLLACGMSTARE
jgi:hypothetical protein